MKRTVTTIALTSILSLFILSGTAFAGGQHGRGGGPGHRGGPGGEGPGFGGGILHAVWQLDDLTEKQEAQIDELVLQMRKDTRAAMKAVRPLRQELHQLVKDGAGDAEIGAKVDQIHQAKASVATKRALTMRDIGQVLTEEQRQALEECRGPEGRGRRPQGKGRGPAMDQ